MTIEEAAAFIDARDDEHGKDPDFVTLKGLARGLAILAKHAPETMYSFGHEEGFFEFVSSITEGEVHELHRLGFRIDNDMWAKFS
jgi:hypothetical protein